MTDPNHQTAGQEARLLPHYNVVPGVKQRAGYVTTDIPATEQRGWRGGRRVPVAVLWRSCGTGMFRLVTPEGETALWPWVQWHNGNGRLRYMPLGEWLARYPSPTKKAAS